ncbi:MAG: hypothetical protein QM726_22045 [Chitinophagaceae bacterium]
MKLFFTTLAIVIAQFAFAGSETPSTVNFPKSVTASLKEEKSLFEAEKAKVCACQLMKVLSNNDKEQLIAVFAQGTNNGNLSANFATASSIIEKEKKHLKAMFYTNIKTTETVTASTPCSQLAKSIKIKHADVKVYDVLDADALSKVRTENK